MTSKKAAVERFFAQQDVTNFKTPAMKYIENNKQEHLQEIEDDNMYDLKAGLYWGEACFKHMLTPAVSDEEIDCMQNCYAKALETRERFFLKWNDQFI